MVRSKGVYQPLLILIGLVLCIIFLMVVFKLMGQSQAFQYELQAEITTKNMQTAMNRVCVTGEPQEVEVNFPQRLSSGGLMKHPVTLGKSLVEGDFNAVADGLRYMSALDSYGDPWYIIYYENFPQGEDSGWTGWSSVATMRTASTYYTFVDTASCLVPVMGDIKRAGSRFAKGLIGAEKVADAYQGTRSFGLITRLADDIYFITKTNPVAGEGTWMREIGSRILRNTKKAYDKSIGGVFRRFGTSIDEPALAAMNRHVEAFSKIEGESLPEVSSRLGFLKENLASHQAGKGKIDDVLKQIDNMKTDTALTEGAYKATLKNFASGDEIKAIYRASGDMVEADLSSVKLMLKGRGTLTDNEVKYLDNLVDRVLNGGEVTANDVRLVRSMTEDPVTHQTIRGAENFVNTVENTHVIQSDMKELGSLSDKLLPDSSVVKYPIEYTRTYLRAVDQKRLSLPSLAAYAALVGKGGAALAGGKIFVFREGRWVATSYGGSFIFNGLVVSPFEQSQYKFYPCSGNALCLKSAVNPSISVYPLEDCKSAGVDYVELDKSPIGGITTSTTSALNSAGSFVFGGKTTSKFYTASPCSGKVKIERGTCDCIEKEMAYVDFSSIDAYMIKCETLEFGASEVKLKCGLYKNRTYIGDFGKLETLDANIIVCAKYSDNSESKTYDITFNLTDSGDCSDFPGVKKAGFSDNHLWDYYFGDYFKTLYSESQKPENLVELSSGSFDLKCDFSLVDKEPNQKFDCEQIAFPAVPFVYHYCDDKSNIWLECTRWEKTGESTSELVKEGFDEKEKIPSNKWCCLDWVISKEDGSSNPPAAEVLSVPSCGSYPSDSAGKEIIENNMRCSFGLEGCLRIVSDNSEPWRIGDEARTFRVEGTGSFSGSLPAWSAGPSEICKIESGENSESASIRPLEAGSCVIEVSFNGKAATYVQEIKEAMEPGEEDVESQEAEPATQVAGSSSGDWGVDSASYIPFASRDIWLAILSSKEITLPKVSDGGSEIDPNPKNGDPGISRLYWYNLPLMLEDSKKTECLKVKYIASEEGKDVTGGFCYTSPTAWADVKGIGWVVAATAVDIGTELVIGAATAGGGTVSGIGGLASCMAGNLVMWYGEQAVAKEKQQAYWPNSVYFKNYFT